MIDNFGTSYQNTINDINKKATPVKVTKSIKKDEQPKSDVENTHSSAEIKLFTDGGSRGNPGPSAAK